MPFNSNRLLVAEIGAAHGIRGLVKLRVYCDDLNLLDDQDLFTHEDGDQTLHLTLARANDHIILAGIQGVSDRTAAEKLRGIKLYLPREHLPEIKEDGVYYATDLIGLAVHDFGGAAIGTVLDIVNFGASDLIDIRPTAGPSFYLPFTDDYIPKIDVEGGFIVVSNYAPFLPEPPVKKEKP